MSTERSTERPLSIPELRGMPPIPRDREQPYSAESYAAQYGITVRGAQDLLERSTSHQQIHRQILAMFQNDPALKRRALMLETTQPLSQEEEHRYRRILAGGLPVKGMEE